jgi:hypothetical protein
MKAIKKPYVVVAIVLLSLGLVYFLASYAVPRVFVSMTKAAPASKVSLTNSRIIGETILAKADGIDKCVVNVFVMDATGKGVSGRQVFLSGMEGILPAVAATDNSGKAAFSMTSTVEKQYDISANVDGVELPKTVKVTFRND